ncbi:MAG: transglycosylase SLT domain-containing protein [Bacteroidia bacterium]
MLKSYFKILALLAWFHSPAQPLATNELPVPADKEKGLCSCVIGVCHPLSTQSSNYVFDQQIYQNGCDTLPQVIFWEHIMNLHKDSSLVCIGHNRKVVSTFHNKDWQSRSDSLKHSYRDSIRMAYGLDSASHILVTPGKQFFYAFDKAFANFDRGINDFVENGVDPWYAQAILLIESPNKLQKSNVGAYGPFQLMKEVARLFGLKVNKQIDERADFDRSAYAASSLIKTICIPYTRQILDSLHITYNESDLWFRLLVMHSYHAGAGNVKKALYSFMPTKGDMNLIYTLWHTTTRHFKSASQNYSQLVLASMIEMDKRIKFPPHVEQKIAGGGR